MLAQKVPTWLNLADMCAPKKTCLAPAFKNCIHVCPCVHLCGREDCTGSESESWTLAKLGELDCQSSARLFRTWTAAGESYEAPRGARRQSPLDVLSVSTRLSQSLLDHFGRIKLFAPSRDKMRVVLSTFFNSLTFTFTFKSTHTDSHVHVRVHLITTLFIKLHHTEQH